MNLTKTPGADDVPPCIITGHGMAADFERPFARPGGGVCRLGTRVACASAGIPDSDSNEPGTGRGGLESNDGYPGRNGKSVVQRDPAAGGERAVAAPTRRAFTSGSKRREK